MSTWKAYVGRLFGGWNKAPAAGFVTEYSHQLASATLVQSTIANLREELSQKKIGNIIAGAGSSVKINLYGSISSPLQM